ncbi:MAG TPA: hypothetical protein PKO45_01895 [Rubrivivax sp.]|nr:hypothetical protein [Burkholderiales bacterium]HNT37848.1 hypothetical protein [Rubrivivax sp.]
MNLRFQARPPSPAPSALPLLLAPLFVLLLCATAARAQTEAGTAASQVYRCPGPPVLYTDAISPKEAAERGCRTIEGTPITIIQGPRPRAAPAGASAPARAGSEQARVEPAAQRQRDSEARRILEDELKREEEKLAALRKDYNNGQPERRGDERNYQRYLDRVAEMKAAITRKEADVAALKREIAKLPTP